MVAGSFDAIFHGTKFAVKIVEEQPLHCGDYNNDICFSRSPDVAARFAAGTSIDWDRRGAVLVLDRARLRQAYPLIIPQTEFSSSLPRHEHEMQERVVERDVTNLDRYLIGVVWEPEDWWEPFDWSSLCRKVGDDPASHSPGARFSRRNMRPMHHTIQHISSTALRSA